MVRTSELLEIEWNQLKFELYRTQTLPQNMSRLKKKSLEIRKRKSNERMSNTLKSETLEQKQTCQTSNKERMAVARKSGTLKQKQASQTFNKERIAIALECESLEQKQTRLNIQ